MQVADWMTLQNFEREILWRAGDAPSQYNFGRGLADTEGKQSLRLAEVLGSCPVALLERVT